MCPPLVAPLGLCPPNSVFKKSRRGGGQGLGGRHFTQGGRRTVVIGGTFGRNFSSLEGALKYIFPVKIFAIGGRRTIEKGRRGGPWTSAPSAYAPGPLERSGDVHCPRGRAPTPLGNSLAISEPTGGSQGEDIWGNQPIPEVPTRNNVQDQSCGVGVEVTENPSTPQPCEFS